MMKVAIYARLTALDKAAMDKQITDLKAAVAEHEDWELYGVYFDFASGTAEDMPLEMEHLLADCKAHNICIVVIRDISRLTRNVQQLTERIEVFHGAGIELYLLHEDMKPLSQINDFGLLAGTNS